MTEITDEMVERGAIALWQAGSARGEWGAPTTYPYDRLIQATKDDLRHYARVVLEAKGDLGMSARWVLRGYGGTDWMVCEMELPGATQEEVEAAFGIRATTLGSAEWRAFGGVAYFIDYEADSGDVG